MPTKIRSGQLKIGTGANDVLALDSSGNLDVNGITITSSAYNGSVVLKGGSLYGAVEVDSDFKITNAGNDQVYINSATGRVAINGNPLDTAAKLQVTGDVEIEDAALKFRKADKTVPLALYRGGTNFAVLRDYVDAYTIQQIWSRPGDVITGGDREATLALVRGDEPNQEFLDLYNNGYAAEKQFGIRLQKRGTGLFRDFVIDYDDGTTKTEVLRLKSDQSVTFSGNINVETITGSVAAGLTLIGGDASNDAPIIVKSAYAAGGYQGRFQLYSNTASYTTVKSAYGLAASTYFILPSSNGVAGQILSTDGFGYTSWVSGLTNPLTADLDVASFSIIGSQGIVGPAGQVKITGGTAQVASGVRGGDTIVSGGASDGIAAAGAVNIIGGLANGDGTGTGTGGEILLRPGASASGIPATVRIEGASATDQGEIRFIDNASAGGTSYIGLKAPTVVVTSQTYTLPLVDGAAGDVIQTDGAGALSFVPKSDLGEFTIATLPPAATHANSYALATDAAGGRTVVRSDGTNWMVIAVEGAIVA